MEVSDFPLESDDDLRYIEDAVALLSNRGCAKKIVNRWDLTDRHCLSLLVSKCLGFGIVAAASIVKVPQLLKIVSSKSSEGLNLSSIILETASYSISLAYNYRNANPFSTYGEILFITIQDLLLILMICRYRKAYKTIALFSLPFILSQYYLYQRASSELLQHLQASTIPLTLSSRIPQIIEIARRGNTGNLSAITIFLFFLGAAARVFTTIKEVPDKILLLGCILGAVLNGILTLQMLWYWRVVPKKKKA